MAGIDKPAAVIALRELSARWREHAEISGAAYAHVLEECADDLDALLARVEPQESTFDAELALRQEWWLRHGCPPGSRYSDDGEMQCNSAGCLRDFKREPLHELAAHVDRLRQQRAAAAYTKLRSAVARVESQDESAQPESDQIVQMRKAVEFHRDMAARFAESRNELKHRCRKLEGELAAARVESPPREQEQLRAQKDAAYAERDQLVAALSKLWPAHLARHPDADTAWENDWRWIVCVHSPVGQLTWHIHDSERDWFNHLEVRDGDWDGHATDEKYARLAILAAHHAPPTEPTE